MTSTQAFTHTLDPKRAQDYLLGTSVSYEAKLGRFESMWDCHFKHGQKTKALAEFHAQFHLYLNAYYSTHLCYPVETLVDKPASSEKVTDSVTTSGTGSSTPSSPNTITSTSPTESNVSDPSTRDEGDHSMPGEPGATTSKAKNTIDDFETTSVFVNDTYLALIKAQEEEELTDLLASYSKDAVPELPLHAQLLARFHAMVKALPTQAERDAYSLTIEDTQKPEICKLKFNREGKAFHQILIPKQLPLETIHKTTWTQTYCEAVVGIAKHKITAAINKHPILSAADYLKERRQQAESLATGAPSYLGDTGSVFNKKISQYTFTDDGKTHYLTVTFENKQQTTLPITQDEMTWMQKRLDEGKSVSLNELCSDFVYTNNTTRFSSHYKPIIEELSQTLGLHPNRTKLLPQLRPYFHELTDVMLGDIPLMKFISAPNFTEFKRETAKNS